MLFMSLYISRDELDIRAADQRRDQDLHVFLFQSKRKQIFLKIQYDSVYFEQ